MDLRKSGRILSHQWIFDYIFKLYKQVSKIMDVISHALVTFEYWNIFGPKKILKLNLMLVSLRHFLSIFYFLFLYSSYKFIIVIDRILDCSIFNFKAYLNLKRSKNNLWMACGIFENFFRLRGQLYIMADENPERGHVLNFWA